MFGYEMALCMNSGAEAVDTAIKLVRKWGYLKKKISPNRAIVLASSGNFHGRTMGAISLSTNEESINGFGPLLPLVGARCASSGASIQYGNADDLERALESHSEDIAGFLVEPIQGEAGYL